MGDTVKDVKKLPSGALRLTPSKLGRKLGKMKVYVPCPVNTKPVVFKGPGAKKGQRDLSCASIDIDDEEEMY